MEGEEEASNKDDTVLRSNMTDEAKEQERPLSGRQSQLSKTLGICLLGKKHFSLYTKESVQ